MGRKIPSGNPARRKPPVPMVGSAPVPPLAPPAAPKKKKGGPMGPGALGSMLGAGGPPSMGGGLG